MENFIGEFFLDKIEICDGLVDLFKESKDKRQGAVFDDNLKPEIDLEIKQSLDVSLNPYDKVIDNRFREYLFSLDKVKNKYIDIFPACNRYAPWGIKSNINIQFYKPGDGFKMYHTERSQKNNDRHLVFMTYLNDVDDGGETEFYHQNLKIKAEKGKTIIWPVDWTYTHRGIISSTQEKYIITGWYDFL
jgi:hypothetical protein